MLAALALVGLTCKKAEAPPPLDAAVPTAAAPAADAGAPAPAADEVAWVVSTASLHPRPGRRPVLRALYRGERLVALEHDGDWRRVRLDDGITGWLRKEHYVLDVLATPATVAADTRPWNQSPGPRGQLPRSAHVLPVGTVLFVVRHPKFMVLRDAGFEEVNRVRGRTLWLKASELVTAPAELAAARVAARARALELAGDTAGAAAAWQTLQAEHGETRIAQAIASYPADAAPAADTGVPFAIGRCRAGAWTAVERGDGGVTLTDAPPGEPLRWVDWELLAVTAVDLAVCASSVCPWICVNAPAQVAHPAQPDEGLRASPEAVAAAERKFEEARRAFSAEQKGVELSTPPPGWLVLDDGTLVTSAPWRLHFEMADDERVFGQAEGLLVVAFHQGRATWRAVTLTDDRR